VRNRVSLWGWTIAGAVEMYDAKTRRASAAAQLHLTPAHVFLEAHNNTRHSTGSLLDRQQPSPDLRVCC
jgi:hypothetical protein